MNKVIKLFLLVIFLIWPLYCAHIFKTRPTQIIPLPYHFTNKKVDTTKAEKSNVLILGDSGALEFDNYIPKIIEETSKDLSRPLSIFNWASQNEGLHRTLQKLNSLRKFPKLIIYYGAHNEFYENKFNVKSHREILFNIKQYEDLKMRSLILTLPWTSKFIYKNVSPIRLPKLPKELTISFPSRAQQVYNEVLFKLFSVEFSAFIKKIKESDSNLIVITPAVNLELRPNRSCDNSSSEGVLSAQEDINNLLSEGRSKEALKKSQQLTSVNKGNANTHYLYGQSALKNGNFQLAKKQFTLAKAFDCSPNGPHPVFNSIIKNYAKFEQVEVIDFDSIVSAQVGRNILFSDETTPQMIFYEDLQETLIKRIKDYLKI